MNEDEVALATSILGLVGVFPFRESFSMNRILELEV